MRQPKASRINTVMKSNQPATSASAQAGCYSAVVPFGCAELVGQIPLELGQTPCKGVHHLGTAPQHPITIARDTLPPMRGGVAVALPT